MARGYQNDSVVTANEVANYSGNAAAGLAGTGYDANAPNNEPLTQTARDLALQSFQANQILFNQKIADRNAAFKMIDNEQFVPDEIDEADRPMVDEKLKNLQNIFYSVGGDLLNNPKAYREFVAAAQDAKSTIKHSQKWVIARNADLERLKNTTNTYDQNKFIQAIASQQEKKKGNFWSFYDPYAPVTHYDLNTVAAVPDYTAPVVTYDGLNSISNSTVDIPKTFDSYFKRYGQKANTDQFKEYVDQFRNTPGKIDDVNQRLKEKFGDKVLPIDPLRDRVDQIAAKIALADNEATKQTKDFDKDRANYNLGQGRIAEDRYEANLRNAREKERNAAAAAKGTATATEAPDFGNIIDGVNVPAVTYQGHQVVDSDGTPLTMQNGTLVRPDGAAVTQIGFKSNVTDANGNALILPAADQFEIDVPVGNVNDVVLSEFNKYNQMKEGQNNSGSVIDSKEGSVRLRLKDGQVDGIRTSSGAFADRNQFADITQKQALKGVTKQKPATNLGEYVPSYSRNELKVAGWTDQQIDERVRKGVLKLR